MATLTVVLQALAPAAMALGVAGLGWLLARLTQWINAKTKNAWMAGVLDRLDNFVMTAVKELQQTVVNDMKATGPLTPAQITQLKADALANVKKYWGVQGVAAGAKILGLTDEQIGTLISAKVEAAVHDVGVTQAAVSAVAAAAPALTVPPAAK